MFTSFQASVPSTSTPRPGHQPPAVPQPTKPKRHQIRKACDNCRQARVKCDEIRPCRRCRDSGKKCGNETQNEFKELPPALREIEKLRRYVKGLEQRLAEAKAQAQSAGTAASPAAGSTESTDTPLKIWRGVTIDNLKYGQLSLEFSIHRLCEHFNSETPFLPVPLEPFLPLAVQPEYADMAQRQPSRVQQERFLESFWQGVNVLWPVIDEQDFRQRFARLWDAGNPVRRPDKLVDAVLAVSMQHSVDNLMRTNTDADAGSYFFARWKEAFARHEVDLAQVQSAIIAHVFLVGEWRIDEALQIIGLAIRAAHMLGLHSGAFEAGNHRLNELGRRTWFVLASVENDLALRVDRTPLIQMKHVPRLTDQSGSLEHNHRCSGTTLHWLDFLNMRAELLVLVQTISTQFTAHCHSIDPTLAPRDLADVAAREEVAEFALSSVGALKAWSSSVHPALHLPRSDKSTDSFSTTRSPPDIMSQPLWVSRQQVALELLFHTSCLRILRPFIGNGGGASIVASTPLGDSAAAQAVGHAVMVTGLVAYGKIHDMLRGWRFFCNMLAEAVWCCGAYVTGHPLAPGATSARKTLKVSMAIDAEGVPEMDQQTGCVGAGPRRKMSGKRVIRVVEWLEPMIARVVGGFEAERRVRKGIEVRRAARALNGLDAGPVDESQLYVGLHDIMQTWMNDEIDQMWRGILGVERMDVGELMVGLEGIE